MATSARVDQKAQTPAKRQCRDDAPGVDAQSRRREPPRRSQAQPGLEPPWLAHGTLLPAPSDDVPPLPARRLGPKDPRRHRLEIPEDLETGGDNLDSPTPGDFLGREAPSAPESRRVFYRCPPLPMHRPIQSEWVAEASQATPGRRANAASALPSPKAKQVEPREAQNP